MVNKDYYEILGVGRDADQETIRKAYRKLAMQYHPDRNPGKEQFANEKFKEINEAFSVLGDPDKRRQYDQFGTAGNAGDIFGSPHTRTTFEDLMKDFSGSGLNMDFLDEIFGDALKRGGFSFKIFRQSGGPGEAGFGGLQGINLEELFAQAQQQQQRDVTYEITISKEQATRGMEKDLVRGGKKLRVKIPAGVKSGTRIRLRNARQTTDGEPGDIFILVKVK